MVNISYQLPVDVRDRTSVVYLSFIKCFVLVIKDTTGGYLRLKVTH